MIDKERELAVWTLERDVPGLELCKEMERRGFPQEGIWYWCKSEYEDGCLPTGDVKIVQEWFLTTRDIANNYEKEDVCAAYTVGHMGEWLPENITSEMIIVSGTVIDRKRWKVSEKFAPGSMSFYQDTEANARAKCLIWLDDKGLIKPEELS